LLLLKDTPPQTTSFAGPVDVPVQRNRLTGSFDVDLTVNGVTESWILDTGANISIVSSSCAQRLGVVLSSETNTIHGVTGVNSSFHIAILPELRLGAATLRNIVLLVLDDKAMEMQIGSTRLQTRAFLGYPALSALQRMTITSDGHLLAGPRSPSATNGARIFMHQAFPLVECRVDGRPALFELDTGGNTSLLSDRFRREFPNQCADLGKHPHNGVIGLGGQMGADAYLPHLQLGVGSTVVRLQNVTLLPPLPVRGETAENTYGILGRDLEESYRSFTVDFLTMRFALGDFSERRRPLQ
jgi:hypothetical protein